jgi:DNA mismatch endonuclease, patch repair protein
MAAIRSKHTKPEMLVRRLVFSLGYRFRLHVTTLPGRPDLVLPRFKKIIEVNGCFWHRHDCPEGLRVPKSNRPYWMTKISGNVRRDLANQNLLKDLGWDVLTIWECETRDISNLKRRILLFLRP